MTIDRELAENQRRIDASEAGVRAAEGSETGDIQHDMPGLEMKLKQLAAERGRLIAKRANPQSGSKADK